MRFRLNKTLLREICIDGASVTRLILIVLAFFSAVTFCNMGSAQQPLVVSSESGSDTVDLYSDRKLSRGIERARERIASGEFSQAIRFLDEVLADAQDSFVTTSDPGSYRGLKETASNMIRDLSPEGIEFYESMFGPLARKKLSEAISAGDFGQVRTVSQRYFYTSAGFDAAILLAQHEADTGRHLSAVILYQQLLDTPRAAATLNPQLSLLAAQSWIAIGNTERAETLLSKVAASSGAKGQKVVIGGQEKQLTSNTVNWLEEGIGIPDQLQTPFEKEWLLSGGNTARNGRSDGGLPHTRVRWQARLLNRPQFEEVYDDLLVSLEQRQMPLPPAGVPLAVGNTIITTTAHNVVAFDFGTGKRIWQTQPQRVAEFEELLSLNEENSLNEPNLDLAQTFSHRIWNDYLYNSISSDGDRVFVIRDLSIAQLADNDIWALPFRGGGTPGQTSESTNRLCAYELATQGKLVWEIDGAARKDELAGAFFLGAPISVNELLYCLAEIKSSVHLVAIDRQTGQLKWLQQLADLHAGIPLDPQRRMQGAVPSYDAGMMVCPTAAGVLVGFNLEKNSFAWHFRYENNRTALEYLRRSRGRTRETTGKWIDGSVILAEGCVLLSPPESDSIYCLELSTGKLLWERQREDGIFVAGVDKGKVLIVGNQSLFAVSLLEGRPVWEQQEMPLPSGANPSGRGFLSSEKYFLPLSNGQVIAVELANGKIAEKVVARSGAILGNLISHRGAILSQSGRFLECFDQIEVLRRMTETKLAENPSDSEALRTLGEITYNEGKLAKAIEYLEKSDAISPENLRTHEVLAECLLEAIEKNYSTYRDRIPKLRELLAISPEQLQKLQRLEASGLVELDKLEEAFEVCLEIFNGNLYNGELHQMDSDYLASTTSWLKAQTALIWQLATAELRQDIASRLVEVRSKLDSDQREPDLTIYLASFGGIDEIAERPAHEMARKHMQEDQLLAAQQWLVDYASLPNTPEAISTLDGETIASFAKILHEAKFDRLALPYDRALAGPLANLECLDGKTGRECVESWTGLDNVKGLPWPYGKVQVDVPLTTKSAVNPRVNVRSPLAEVRLEHGDELLSHCNIFYSSRIAELRIHDQLGNEVSHQILGEQERQVFHGGVYGVARGNLLILSLGQLIVAVDTLAPRSENGDAVLWRKRVLRNPSQRQVYGGYNVRTEMAIPYSSGTPRVQVDGKWIGVIGPLTRDRFVYQDQRGLHCVDPLTGEPQWSRKDTPNACNLFGNDRVVIAVEDSSTKAQVYNLMDGRELGQVEIPLWRDQLATHGTDVFSWQRTKAGRFELESLDASSGETNWKKVYPAGSKIDIEQRRYIAIVEPDGHYQIVDAYDGKVLVDYLGSEQTLAKKLYLFVGSETFVVATGRKPKSQAKENRNWFNVADSAAFDGDLMAFNISTGAPMWSRPAEVRQQSLMLSQPMDSPVISFAGFYHGQDGRGTKPLASILVLEKASGRMLFADEGMQNAGNLCLISADELAHEVTLEMVSRTVKLKFTDLPRPPEPPATVETNAGDKRGSQGLERIFERLWQGS
ncbi:outer membrane protein assembly factor BamB family protein [Bythopirellula polymerisocia]|uniref:Outer membrane biogenesis protein BamB n=1 Tax=Bythopirellula polymerisocia TaxID=2528003 RepID=A0A5C6CX96_9BACT|nr:PQQ-binding-like beta-propeller repeat protein [Bythopirellula polymerisocia]TWU27249.1 outer membrane biogenesis protein BamB [Bythopirellula polymerisocia]